MYDEDDDFNTRFNPGLADLEHVTDSKDISTLRRMIEEHLMHTASIPARRILAQWDKSLAKFKKIMPRDYREGAGREKAQGRGG